MRKFSKIGLVGLALNAVMLTSCFGPSKEEIQKDIDWNLTYSFGSGGNEYKREITEKEFILAPAESYFIIGEDKCDLPITWTSNNQYVSLQYVSTKDSGFGLFGGKFYNDPYYTATVSSFPEQDTDVSFSLAVSYKGETYEREYIATLKSQDDQFIAENMRGWKKRGSTLSYYHHYESDLVGSGQAYYDISKSATWDLDTNIVTASSRTKKGYGGSAEMWVDGDYKYTYDVNYQLLSCEEIGDLDLSRTYSSTQYETLGKKWEDPLGDFSQILKGINKYLVHINEEYLCSVPEAERGVKKLFNVTN